MTTHNPGNMKLRIAQFIETSGPGGAETLVKTLCLALAKAGHDVTLLHFGKQQMLQSLEEHNIRHLDIGGRSFYKNALTLPYFCWHFAKVLRKLNIDVLHSHLTSGVITAGISSRLAKIPHVGTLHDLHSLEEHPLSVKFLHGCARAGSNLVTVSHGIKKHLESHGSWNCGWNCNRNCKWKGIPATTIYNGIAPPELPLPDLPGAQQRADYRHALGLEPSAFAFICVARLSTVKQHETLLKALEILHHRRLSCATSDASALNSNNSPDYQLLLVGTGPRDAKLRQLAKDMQLSAYVKFLGHRTDVTQLLQASDCFVLTSQSEGLSCSIIEAMHAGLPVIATDVGGNGELISHGKTGYLTPCGDANQLAEHLANALDNRSLLQQLGAQGQIVARGTFSLAPMIESYLEVYSKAIGGKTPV